MRVEPPVASNVILFYRSMMTAANLDSTMTRMSLVTLLQEHHEFARGLLKLILAGAYANAAYVTAIMQTDLAEVGKVPPGCTWLRPGQLPPNGWEVYKTALRWCHGGYRR
jgi:hypothetical protein